MTNPYGNGGVAQKILEVIEGFDLKEVLYKGFYDIK